MEARATGWFRDKETRKIYAPGQVYSGRPARVRELANLGYVEAEPPCPPTEPKGDKEPKDGAVRD